LGVEAYLIDHFSQIQSSWLGGKSSVGVTSGASAPEQLVRELLNHLESLGGRLVETEPTTVEEVEFSLPNALR